MTLREKIERLERYDCGTCADGGADMFTEPNGEYLKRADVLSLLTPPPDSEEVEPTKERMRATLEEIISLTHSASVHNEHAVACRSAAIESLYGSHVGNAALDIPPQGEA